MLKFTRCRTRVVGSIVAGAMFFASTGARPVLAMPATDAEKQQQVTAMLQRLSVISQRELAKPGADPSDVKQKAASLGNDPEKIFAFVRDEVRYEPYAG